MDNTRLLAGFQREQWQGFPLEERKKKKLGWGVYYSHKGSSTIGQVIIIAGSLNFFFL